VNEELDAIPDQVLASWEEQEGESMRDGHAATLKRLIGEAVDRAYRLGEDAGLERAADAIRDVDNCGYDNSDYVVLVRALKGKVSDGE
jgi:hypothetical protein